MAASSADDNKSNKIVFLYNDNKDKQKYEDIESVLRKPAEKEDFEICSYDNIPPGGYIATGLYEHIRQGCIIVMITTKNFIEDSKKAYESALAILEFIENRCNFLIPIKYACADIPGTLTVFTPIDGTKSAEHIAKKIMQTVKYYKQKNTSSSMKNTSSSMKNTSSSMDDDPLLVIVRNFDQYKAKKDTLIEAAAIALINHYDLDNKMEKLHRDMKSHVEGNVPVPESDGEDCPCSQGELWKKEISEKKYWAIGENGLKKPEPFRNIQKSRDENKHTRDIHELSNGYLKLASVFLTKRPTDDISVSTNSLSKYMDVEGVLLLLLRCNIGLSDADRKKIQDLKDLRIDVAHSKIKSTEDATKMIRELGKNIKRAMYRVLEFDEYDRLWNEIDQMVKVDLTPTIPPESEARV